MGTYTTNCQNSFFFFRLYSEVHQNTYLLCNEELQWECKSTEKYMLNIINQLQGNLH